LKEKTMVSHLQPELPPISMRMCDANRLRNIAEAASEKYPQTTDFLAREIERAEILPDARLLPGLVTMDSEVTFRDDISMQERAVTLVYPEAADVDAGRISILTPIGAALIGLSVGQTIEFQTPGGRWRSLTVLRVQQPR
jgi:regulator of nucleoside diphosphate kinase